MTDQPKMTEVEYFRDLLNRLFNLKNFSLGDQVYEVREREGKGWDGPHVKAFSDLVEELKKAARKNGKLPDHVQTGKSAIELQTAQGVLEAAKALVADVKARYPGEELRCPHMRAIDEGLTKLAVMHWFFSPIARRQPVPPPCAFPDKGLTLCGAINHPNGLTTCDVIGCPRMARAQ